MTRPALALLALLGLCAAAAPAAAQTRSASIRVGATIAEPIRMPETPSVKLELREGKYLDVTASGAAAGPVPYLTRVVVSSPSGTGPDAARGRPLPSAGGEARYRLELEGRSPAPDGAVQVTYVIASNL